MSPVDDAVKNNMAKAVTTRDAQAFRPRSPTRERELLSNTAAPHHSLGYLIKESQRAFTRALQSRLEPWGITVGQWFFLRELWGEEGLSQRELSRRMGVSEPTTVTALKLMVERKLIERRRKGEDRRSLYVFLTPRGRALRDRVLPSALTVNDAAACGFSAKEVAKLRATLGRMIRNLEDDQA